MLRFAKSKYLSKCEQNYFLLFSPFSFFRESHNRSEIPSVNLTGSAEVYDFLKNLLMKQRDNYSVIKFCSLP